MIELDVPEEELMQRLLLRGQMSGRSDDNEATDGPNFINPTTEAGTNGHNESADWMIGRINNLTDNGWTFLEQNDNRDGFKTTADGKSDGSGIYWSTRYDQGNATLAIGEETYMKYANTSDTSKKMMRVSLQLVGGGHAGFRGLSVNEDMAGAAGALAAAVLYGGQTQLVPQKTQQFLVLFRRHQLTVDIE